MRYMMLIHHDEVALANAPQKELWADYAAFWQILEFQAGPAMRMHPAAQKARQWRQGETDAIFAHLLGKDVESIA